MGPALECGWLYPETLHWTKWISPFLSRYQWQTASWLGMGHCVHFPFSLLGSCLVGACVDAMHAVRISMNSYVCISPVVSTRLFFLRVIHHFWLLQSFHLLFHKDPRALRVWHRLPVWGGVLQCLLVSAHGLIVDLLAKLLFKVRRSFSDKGWAML